MVATRSRVKLTVTQLLEQFGLHYRIRVKGVTSIVLAKQSKWVPSGTLVGQNHVSPVREKERDRECGKRLPHVRPYCTRSLGPQLPAGGCRRLFYCSERPGSGLSRPEGAQIAPKWPKITPNRSTQPSGRVQTGSTILPYVRRPQGHETRPLGDPCGPLGLRFLPIWAQKRLPPQPH